MNIYSDIVTKEIENIINSFIFDPHNNITIYKLNMKLCDVIKKYGIYNTFPYCRICDSNNVSILFKNSNGDCKLKFQI